MSQSTDPRPTTWHAPGAESMADQHETAAGDRPGDSSIPVSHHDRPAPPPGPQFPQAYPPPDAGYPGTGGAPAGPGPAAQAPQGPGQGPQVYGSGGYGTGAYGTGAYGQAGQAGYPQGAYQSGPAWTHTTAPVPGTGPANPFASPQPAPPGPGQVPGQVPPQGPGQVPGATVHGPRREKRHPGWGGVIVVGAGAAVLSSLLTAGVVSSMKDDTTEPVAASSRASQPAPPLVTGSAKLPDWAAVANAVEPSVVSVRVEAGRTGGEGSGVILDTSGRILTNNHVVAAAAGGQGTISVVLSDGRSYPSSIVGTDPSTDLAVIKLNSSVSGLKAATFGDSSAVNPGDPVLAAGNPLGLSDTVTTGIVSAVNRPVSTSAETQDPLSQTPGEPVVTNAIQTDASINPGNSGGALVDSGGRVIGITSSIASLGSSGGGQSGSIGLGFAIPINEAKSVADQLVKNGKVQHAFMGVGLQDNSVAVDGAQREAAVVRSVVADSPAAKAGLKVGDAVIALNKQRIDSRNSLIGSIRALTPGTQVTVTLVRGGSQQDVSITLGISQNK